MTFQNRAHLSKSAEKQQSYLMLKYRRSRWRTLYGEEALKDRQSRNWFDKFRSGDFSLKDEQCSDRPNEVDDDQIKGIIESNRHVTVREIEEMLKIQKSTIERHIQRIGLVKKLDILIPHELKKIHLTKRIDACDLHLNSSITLFEDDRGSSVMNHHKQHRMLNCIQKRLCYLFGEIGKVWYFLSSFQVPRN